MTEPIILLTTLGGGVIAYLFKENRALKKRINNMENLLLDVANVLGNTKIKDINKQNKELSERIIRSLKK